MQKNFIEVVFPLPLERAFHYEDLPQTTPLGSRVLAPFGKKTLVGYVVGRTSEPPPFATKPILQCLDPEPFLDEQLLELGRWLADRYLCSLGDALACIAPTVLAAPKRQAAGSPPGGHKGRPYRMGDPSGRPPLTLTPEQRRALEPLLAAADAHRFEPFLLRGITDSGKTEIYFRTIDHVLEQGRQALFLLPEIALTPLFIARLRERYGVEHVGLWHSGVSAGERYRTWRGVRKGDIRVLLGARSAVFAPFPNLGVIVLDEEHEPSYKQEERPRYHARDVALKRAELSKALLIMGTATPSLESYWKALNGHYRLLEMTSRVEERKLPPVELIDMRPPSKEKPAGEGDLKPRRAARTVSRYSAFSEALKLAMEMRLAKRQQIMLFVNRRGYTPFLRCQKCGWVARCQRCSMTLSLHLGNPGGDLVSNRYMQCHACVRKEPVPTQCPACRSIKLHQYGIGTQKVEEEIRALFPFAITARLDRDIAAKRHVYEKVYDDFSAGKVDILVGTQMIAKGFDFPNVTLVGVVDADSALYLPDFRAAERTFDLITQVAGRTGRGPSGGRVVVQTHHPEHYALQTAAAHDYLKFYDVELVDRERLKYPPFCRLVNVLLRTTKEPSAQQAADLLYEKLVDLNAHIDILGPAPAPYSRLNNQFRYQILLKGDDAELGLVLKFLKSYKPAKAYMSIDVDPIDLL